MSTLSPWPTESWIPVPEDSHFPIQNLPFGLAAWSDGSESLVVRIGDQVLDLCALAACGVLPSAEFPALHSLIDLDVDDLRSLRRRVADLLSVDNPTLQRDHARCADAFSHVNDVELRVPTEIPHFVDFYAGIHHAANVGRMFRPDLPPLLPSYRHIPLAYNGRPSTIVPSGVEISRPLGVHLGPDSPTPVFAPTQELDFELELAAFVARGNRMGERVSVDGALSHVLGFVLLNDWSARDVQRFEFQPLGPFLAKSFATSISPWIVLTDALEPFRVTGDEQEPAPMPHLRSLGNYHLDLQMEVSLQTAQMTRPQVISRTNARHIYWSFPQLIAHLTSNGTAMEPGDLLASGTISGPNEGTYGSLLELTWRATHPIELTETGEKRTYLEDGDTVIMSAFAQGDGFRIGFGELRNTVIG